MTMLTIKILFTINSLKKKKKKKLFIQKHYVHYFCLGKLLQILFGLNLPFSLFALDANFLFFNNCVIHYFGLQVHAARLILSLVFVGSQVLICVDIIVPCLL